jgi:prepilin signal peptidase PulO-like enzyme (type II secretory pathway)
MIVAILVVLGLSLGSFINALVWRLHEQGKEKGKKNQNLSIINGRSVCPDCRHALAWYDLIPVASWLSLGGRCRYCRRPISWQYPLVELTMALVFVLSYLFWPGSLNLGGQKLLLAVWLAASVGLLALLVYDWRWMLLPNRILYPAFFIALAGRLAYIIFYAGDKAHSLILLIASLAVTSGIFFILYILGRGRWIGFGDVRLGLVTGSLIADPAQAFLMIFLAALMGTILALPGLVGGKLQLAQRIPFGPFLITATGVTVLFGAQIVDWYRRIFLS